MRQATDEKNQFQAIMLKYCPQYDLLKGVMLNRSFTVPPIASDKLCNTSANSDKPTPPLLQAQTESARTSHIFDSNSESDDEDLKTSHAENEKNLNSGSVIPLLNSVIKLAAETFFSQPTKAPFKRFNLMPYLQENKTCKGFNSSKDEKWLKTCRQIRRAFKMNLAHNTKMKKLKRDKFDRERERLAEKEALHEMNMKVKLMHKYKTL